jgi:hypothetical protein
MPDSDVSAARRLLNLRRQHPAWRLLAARTGPLVVASLQGLFEENLHGIDTDMAHQALSESLRLAHEAGEIDCEDDYLLLARREIRQWIRLGLILERDGRLIATDALESTFRFVDGLDNRIMTSTASRLSIVQREIEHLTQRMDPDPETRSRVLERRIQALRDELEAVLSGEVEVLEEQAAVEAIREVFSLAMSLRNDFRRVEDSYRAADQRLRESVVREDSHRGQIVDTLLDSHESLLQTEEGKVFDAFQRQLASSVELDAMKRQIRWLSQQPEMSRALSMEQQAELRCLVMRLVGESSAVIDARARSERDVKGFLRTGLASEHHRVGRLLNDILAQAGAVDWSRQALRRTPSPLPPMGFGNPALPLVERLRFKDLDQGLQPILELVEQNADLDQVDADFWQGFDSLDRTALVDQTRQLLHERDNTMSIAEIARQIPTKHDLEALAVWLTLAMEWELPMPETDRLELTDENGVALCFTLPKAELSADILDQMSIEL